MIFILKIIKINTFLKYYLAVSSKKGLFTQPHAVFGQFRVLFLFLAKKKNTCTRAEPSFKTVPCSPWALCLERPLFCWIPDW
jgi:hypothetical protein